MTSESKTGSESNQVHFLVVVAMFAVALAYAIMNSYEPQIDRQYDFFELIFPLSEFAAGGFALVVAKRYWGSEVFGRAYLSLGIGCICAGTGTALFGVFEVYYGIDNPFPNWNDLFTGSYYLFLLYHLTSCIRYFKRKFSKKDKLLIIMLPLTTTSILLGYTFFSFEIPGSVPDILSHQIKVGDTTFKLVPVSSPSGKHQHITVSDVIYELVPENLTTTRYQQVPTTHSPINFVPITVSNLVVNEISMEKDSTFWIGVGLQSYYYTMTTLTLSFAVMGSYIFRRSMLGNAWGLLLLGIGLTSVGDLIYYLNAVHTYDRTYPDIAFWVLGYLIISYALYLHRKIL